MGVVKTFSGTAVVSGTGVGTAVMGRVVGVEVGFGTVGMIFTWGIGVAVLTGVGVVEGVGVREAGTRAAPSVGVERTGWFRWLKSESTE
jgi:hypothetical protein